MKMLLVVAAAALAAAAPALGATKPKVLVGTVGPGFTITLKSGGKAVKSLLAGKYVVKVSDQASIHNFHLRGPGVNKATDIAGMGSATWNVTLKKGTYTFQCDPHASAGMLGSFTVK